MIGPHLRAASLFLQYDIGLTTRKVVRTLAGLAQFDFVPASLLHFGQQAAHKAKPLAKDVAEKLRACDANHADETYYRVNGKPAIVWFHGNEHLAHFCVAGTRSGKVSRRSSAKTTKADSTPTATPATTATQPRSSRNVSRI